MIPSLLGWVLAEGVFEGAMRGAIIGAIVGGVAGVIITFAKKKKKDDSDKQ